MPYIAGILLIAWAVWQSVQIGELAKDTRKVGEEISALQRQQDTLQSESDRRQAETLEAISTLQSQVEDMEFKPNPDIALSPELQSYTYNLCREYGVPYEVVLSVMYTETGFRDLTVRDTNGYLSTGFMMVNAINWTDMEAQGIDMGTAEGRIEAGVAILADYWRRYPPEMALASYNAGEQGMKNGGGRRYAVRVLEVRNDYKMSEV